MESISSFVLNVLASILAALLLGAVGFAGTKLRRRRGTKISWLDFDSSVKLSARPGRLRRALGFRPLFLSLLVASTGAFITALPYSSISKDVGFTEPPNAEFFQNMANARADFHRARGKQAVDQSENEAEIILQKAEEQARNLRSLRAPSRAEEANRLLDREREHAARVIKNGQEAAASMMEDSQKEVAEIRSRARAADSRGPLSLPGTINALAQLATDLASNAILALFLVWVCEFWGLNRTSRSAILAVGVIIVVSIIFTNIGIADGLLSMFWPLLVGAALVAGFQRNLTTGEIVLSSFYLVYRRFGRALVLALFASVLASSLALSIYWLTSPVSDAFPPSVTFIQSGPVPYLYSSPARGVVLANELFEWDLDDDDMQLVSSHLTLFTEGHGAVVLRFFESFFAAVSGAMFLSVLIGPSYRTTKVTDGKLENELEKANELL